MTVQYHFSQLVSLINGVKLGPEMQHLAQLDTTTFMISALKDDGVIDLKNYLLSIAVEKPWLIPKEEGVTDLTIEERVEQIVLEMMLDHTHNEIPYIADIQCKSLADLSSTRVKIEVDIKVDSGGQQRIVVGHQGRTSADPLRRPQAGHLWLRRRGLQEYESDDGQAARHRAEVHPPPPDRHPPLRQGHRRGGAEDRARL